jgi:hypothetical protein
MTRSCIWSQFGAQIVELNRGNVDHIERCLFVIYDHLVERLSVA